MKKLKLYLPLEIDFVHNDLHSELIERYGAHGLGIYFMVLMELRNHEGYRCRLSTLKGAARRCMADLEMLESVLRDFELFEFHPHGDTVMISSPYIDRVMQPFDEKAGRFSSTASEKTVTVERPVHGVSTVTHRDNIIINKTKIKTKTTTSTTKRKAAAAAKADAAVADAVAVNEAMPKTNAPRPAKSWEVFLEQAIADEQWMQLLAMNSGMGKLFTKHRQLVVDTFRQHVVLQGNDASLHSANQVKAYLANFTRLISGTWNTRLFSTECRFHSGQMKVASASNEGFIRAG